jgi:hypothetical protein
MALPVREFLSFIQSGEIDDQCFNRGTTFIKSPGKHIEEQLSKKQRFFSVG